VEGFIIYYYLLFPDVKELKVSLTFNSERLIKTSRSEPLKIKIPVKITVGSVARRDLFSALKG
jgi:hypothetical protein